MMNRIVKGTDIKVVFDREFEKGNNLGNNLISLEIIILPTESLKFRFRVFGSRDEIVEVLKRYSGKSIQVTAPGILVNGYIDFLPVPFTESSDITCEFDGIFFQK